MGQIRNISTQATNITYRMDDGTGTIEVKQWIDTESDTPSKSKFETDGWARVWGRLKAFNNKRHVGAHVIRPLTDMNEINAHLLEATFVHLYFTRGPPELLNGNTTAQQGQYGQNGAVSYQDAGQPNSRLLPHMSVTAKRVYDVLITSPQSNEGLHIQNVALALGLPIAEVMKAGDELLSTGQIYTTVDDNTWAIMDAS